MCAALVLGVSGAVGWTHSAPVRDKLPHAAFDTERGSTRGPVLLGRTYEVALMLDVTRSMEGDKLSNLKEAAKDLIDRVISDDKAAPTSRVALVPFAQSIRLPQAAYHRAVGVNAGASDTAVAFTKDVTQWHWYRGWETVQQTYYTTRCVAERTGVEAFTDTAPGPAAYATAVVRAENSEDCEQASSNTITPLTSNKMVLGTAVDQLTVSTERAAGHLGAAWAWYALSPKWNNVWASTAHQASVYGSNETQKIAILMSDGAFNTQYTNEGLTSEASEAPNGSSAEQTRQLCIAMKASGVIVYTVGLDLGPHAPVAKTLSQCATDDSKALRAVDSNALKQTFKAIAQDITKSGLSS